MKKKFGLLLFILMFSLTGCVKFNTTMDIKKDKSMEYTIIYAIDKSLLGDQELFDEDEKKELEEKGFKTEKYNKNNMEGFKLTKNIANIDEYSSTEKSKYSISGLLNSSKESEEKYIFSVKKGLLKNVYTAKLSFDANDSELNSSSGNNELDNGENSFRDADEDEITSGEDITDEDVITSEEDTNIMSEEDTTDNSDNDMDLEGLNNLASNMDLSFNVNLPYPALSNNANKTNNDNKSLSWTLSSDSQENIEFVFELYNMTNIYIGAGVAGLLVIIIIVLIVTKMKKKPKKDNNTPTPETATATMQQNAPATVQPVNSNTSIPEVAPNQAMAVTPEATAMPNPTVQQPAPVAPTQQTTPVITQAPVAQPTAPIVTPDQVAQQTAQVITPDQVAQQTASVSTNQMPNPQDAVGLGVTPENPNNPNNQNPNM